MPRFRNLSGQKFGRLTVVSLAPKGCRTRWNCVCDCGNQVVVQGIDLTQNKQKSCGCFNQERRIACNTTHGMSGTVEHHSWLAMKSRCYNQNDDRYEDYAGRGISVCQQWRDSFEQFYADMGPRPPGMRSIDRINNNGNYEPGNCRWANDFCQSRNKRNNVMAEAFGVSRCLSEWASILETSSSHIGWVVNRGKGIEWLAAKRGLTCWSVAAPRQING